MIKAFFSIVRWPNLVLIACMQFLAYFKLMQPERSIMSFSEAMLLVLITAIITASGFIINDYYDIEIDKINKPSKWIAGNIWSKSTVLRFYKILIVLGACFSLIVAYRLNMLLYFPVYLLAVVGLQVYSSHLKCSPIIGNLWVSFFCAGVILIMGLPDLLRRTPDIVLPQFWHYIFFAFFTTYYREMIKDLEDQEGDRKNGCQTFVVRFGLRRAKLLSIITAILLLATFFWWISAQSNWLFRIGLVILQLGVILSAGLVWRAGDNRYFHQASTIVKLVMAIGTLLLLIPS